LIQEWFGTKSVTAQLLYLGSENEFKATAFHEKCDKLGPTLTVARSAMGLVFGGFTSKPWSTVYDYVPDNHSFLFSMDKRTKLVPNPSYTCYSTYHNPSYLPTFGGGHDLNFKDSCNTNEGNYSNLGCYYVIPDSSIAYCTPEA